MKAVLSVLDGNSVLNQRKQAGRAGGGGGFMEDLKKMGVFRLVR